MILKFSKIIVCLVAVGCLLGNSFTAFATNADLDFEFNIQPEIPTTEEETVAVETEKETEEPTEKETTEKPTTEKPTKKPTKPHTTEKRQDPQTPAANANVNETAAQTSTTKEETTAEESTDEPLPEGSFYVYLERNNGQRRLKNVMNKAGYVPDPGEPVREGYVFVGWYKDPDFKTKWDFYKDKTDKTITIYAKWKANEGTVNYDIIIEDMVGGKLEVNPKNASLGEPVVITVIPDEGKRLVQGSVRINGEPTDFLSFVMPKGKVTISAEFENIPENEENNEKSKLPVFVVLGVVLIILIVIVIIIAKKRRDFNADLDPEEDLIVEDDNDDNWIDETIVVEDGFKEGKKVVENTEPDYGAPDLIEEDLD